MSVAEQAPKINPALNNIVSDSLFIFFMFILLIYQFVSDDDGFICLCVRLDGRTDVEDGRYIRGGDHFIRRTLTDDFAVR